MATEYCFTVNGMRRTTTEKKSLLRYLRDDLHLFSVKDGCSEGACGTDVYKRQDDDMVKAMFGGHALFTISDKTFEKMVEANDGMTGFHIHVAEGMNDVYDSIRNYGCRPVNRLLYNGLLGEKTMLGHCIHVSPAEDVYKRQR